MTESTKIVSNAVTALLRSHADTGTDITTWPGVLELVVSVHPKIILEGTGPASQNTVVSPAGETGRYWLDGDMTKPCNDDAWGAFPSMYSPALGTTRELHAL